ncbi:MAG: hypothetical protein K5864_02040 [Bacteroidales bacterium]|nr:hypothetical protein [Bacteroidales bacterium]
MKEYTLFPIKTTDVDWPLYWMVTCFFKYKYKGDSIPSNDLFDSFQKDRQQDPNNGKLFFVFPGEDLSIHYDTQMLNCEALILNHYYVVDDSSDDDTYDTVFGTFEYPTGGDEYPQLEYYRYQDAASGPKLQKVMSKIYTEPPVFPYTGDSFMKALNGVLEFMQQGQLSTTSWYGRLQTVRQMFYDEANELHILHNAGLFDQATLWRELQAYGIPQKELDAHISGYVSELKQYAMFVLNNLNWRQGTEVHKNDRRDKRGLFEPVSYTQKSKKDEERLRRRSLGIHQETPQQLLKKITFVGTVETAPKPESSPVPKQKQEPQFEANPKTESRPEEKPKPKAPAEPSSQPQQPPVYFFVTEKEGIALIVTLLLVIVCAVVGVVIRSVPLLIAAAAAYVAIQFASRSRNSRQRHPSGFRLVLLALGIVMPFLFCATGYLFMQAMQPKVAPEVVYIIILFLCIITVPFCIIKRRSITDERKVRPFTILLLTAIMAALGNLMGFIIIQAGW